MKILEKKRRGPARVVGVAVAALVLLMWEYPYVLPTANATGDTLNTDTVQKLFKQAGPNSTVDLPAGKYELGGYIQLPRAKNVTINAHGARFTGWVTFLSAGNSGMKWLGGTFAGDGRSRLGFTLLHVRNAKFDGIHFNQADTFGQHLFDLLGSSGLVFDNITARGYGDTTDLSGLEPHDKYAEAIQTDYAIHGASGSEASEQRLLDYGGDLDGAATQDVTVKNCQFRPRYDQGEMSAWAQSPLGQHVYGKDVQNNNVTFRDNTVDDPTPLNDIAQKKYTGALHFVSIRHLNITNNTFSSSKAAKREDWIQVVNNANYTNPGDGSGNLPTVRVKISRNRFEGRAPTHSYVNLISDKGNPKFRICGVAVTDNTASVSDHPAGWVSISDVGSQIQKPVIHGNQREN